MNNSAILRRKMTNRAIIHAQEAPDQMGGCEDCPLCMGSGLVGGASRSKYENFMKPCRAKYNKYKANEKAKLKKGKKQAPPIPPKPKMRKPRLPLKPNAKTANKDDLKAVLKKIEKLNKVKRKDKVKLTGAKYAKLAKSVKEWADAGDMTAERFLANHKIKNIKGAGVLGGGILGGARTKYPNVRQNFLSECFEKRKETKAICARGQREYNKFLKKERQKGKINKKDLVDLLVSMSDLYDRDVLEGATKDELIQGIADEAREGNPVALQFAERYF